jgi:predicted DNA binding CopG/RHH family protein
MNKKINKIPDFKSEDEERDFWAKHDMTEYMEEIREPVSFSNLKPTSRPMSIRLPVYLIARIKEKANAMGISYQALMKIKLFELIKEPPKAG